MPTGPFLSIKPVYVLTWANFTAKAHLKLLTERESLKLGLEVEQQNLEALLADPKDDGGVVQHDSVATISPSFRGLDGTFQVQARPDSRLIPVVSAIGVKLYGTFTETASSASNDLTDVFTRKRFVASGGKTETGGPAGSWVSESVNLKYLPNRERGDEYSDLESVYSEALALAGTLLPGDLLQSPVHGVWQVRGVAVDGGYERARLER